MNVRVLHNTTMPEFYAIRKASDPIFVQTIAVVATTDRDVNAKTFVARLNAALKPMKIRVLLNVDDEFQARGCPNTEYYYPISGSCLEPRTSNIPANIRIIIGIPSTVKRFIMIPESWEFFRYRFLHTILHELVHRAQYAHGRKATNSFVFRPQSKETTTRRIQKEQLYLGELDEIEAYSRDCVEDWYYRHPNTPLTLRQIKKDFRGEPCIPALSFYRDAYGGDEHHLSIQRLFRKIKHWNDLIQPLAQTLPPHPTYIHKVKPPSSLS